SPEVEAAIKGAHKTVWPNIASFRASLDLINLTDLRVVYMAPGATEVSDERLSMSEGLLLAEKDGALVVCATVKGSGAQLAGLKAGDKIVALNGKDLTGASATLAAFFAEYQTNAEQKIGNQKPYKFRVLRGDAAAPLDLSLRPPPSLTGSLLDQ
ncbi:MAG TPA: PDZ domain-containing protein, partial [Candidatus Methylacidiphilales bacterium]